jgi:hypothetical protein
MCENRLLYFAAAEFANIKHVRQYSRFVATSCFCQRLSARVPNMKSTHRRVRPKLPGMWASMKGRDGFAAIPITALDPPDSAASPAVPALHGSGSPSHHGRSWKSGREGLRFSDLLKGRQELFMMQ